MVLLCFPVSFNKCVNDLMFHVFSIYTPGIYAEGYIVFAFLFVHLYVRSFVLSSRL